MISPVFALGLFNIALTLVIIWVIFGIRKGSFMEKKKREKEKKK